ncbi:hypothetical protein HPULCUR_006317 [Helicostylum pulchrum]|uniref:Uncharacterized protein n=1 Tax=Helicostylum pulchrum TaxID=562976 RepID=A0ABP9Y1K1_9FUNG
MSQDNEFKSDSSESNLGVPGPKIEIYMKGKNDENKEPPECNLERDMPGSETNIRQENNESKEFFKGLLFSAAKTESSSLETSNQAEPSSLEPSAQAEPSSVEPSVLIESENSAATDNLPSSSEYARKRHLETQQQFPEETLPVLWDVKPTEIPKICTDTNTKRLVIYGDFEDVNDHYAKDLPDWKKTNSYEFCFRDSCGAMTTLSGSQFIPKNYQHVANEARSKFYETRVCMDDTDPLYPSAIDVYLYNTNFVISWRFNYVNYWPCFSGGIN